MQRVVMHFGLASLANSEAIAKLFNDTIVLFGRLDFVISSVVCRYSPPISGITPSDFDKFFALRVRGPFFVAQEAYKNMSIGGRLILMSTMVDHIVRPSPNQFLGDAAKAFIEALAHSLASGTRSSMSLKDDHS